MAITYDAILRIVAKASGQNQIAQLSAAMDDFGKKAKGVQLVTMGLNRALGGLGIGAGALGVAAIAQNISAAAVEAERSDRRIRALTSSYGELQQVQSIAAKAAKEFALSNIDAQNAVSDLYGRLRPMGTTVKEIETVFFGVNKAARMFGLTAYDVSEVMRQLGQAMGSGRLQGDELRSLMERMPAIGQAVAKVMNVTVGEIKELGSQGKITTDVIVAAAGELNKIQAPPPASFQQYQKSLGDLSTALGIVFLPTLDKVAGGLAAFTSKLVNAINQQRSTIQGFLKFITDYYVLVGKILGAVFPAIGKTFSGVGESLAKNDVTTKQWAESMKGLGGATGKINLDLQQTQRTLETAEQKTAREKIAREEAKEQIKDINKLEQDRTYWLERAGSAYEKQAAQVDLISAAQQRRTALAGEENTLAQAYNNLGKTILQNRLELAKTDEEKLAISKEIAQIESESARLQLEATKLQIQAEEELKAAALNRAISNRKAIESTMALAAAMYNAGQLGMDKIMTYRLELDKAKGAADTAQMEFNQARRINNVKTQAANINYQAAVLQATGGVPASANPGVPAAMGNQTPRRYTTIAGIRIPEYAKGGYVTRPTLAMIGEGGEPEYVVPKSKAKAFANNIASGRTGEQALKPSWREIALETLANSPGDYMRAANAIMTGRRKQGMTWNMHEEERVRTDAIRSLGFGVTDVSPTYGRQVTRSRPLASIRGELEDLRARRSAGMAPGQASITLNTRVDKVIRQDGEDRVTLAQAQALASDAARQAVAQMDRNLASPTYRQKRGIR